MKSRNIAAIAISLNCSDTGSGIKSVTKIIAIVIRNVVGLLSLVSIFFLFVLD